MTVILALTALLGCGIASARIGYAFYGSDCFGCGVELRAVTASGVQSVSTFDQGSSVFTSGGEQIGPLFGKSYLAGFCCYASQQREYRNWFAFDLSGMDAIVSADLRLTIPGRPPPFHHVFSDTGRVVYTLHAIPPHTEGRFLGGGEMDQFQVLGAGAVQGFKEIFMTDEGETISIALNSDAISYLNGVRQYAPPPQSEYYPVAWAVLGGAVSLRALEIPTVGPVSIALLIALMLVFAHKQLFGKQDRSND